MAKSLLDLKVCQGIIGYRLYGVKQIARDQLAMRTYQLRALLLEFTKNTYGKEREKDGKDT